MSQTAGGEQPGPSVIASATSTQDRTLLIADDDVAFRNRIARALELRGFIVTAVGSVAEALPQTSRSPAFAVLDLRLGDRNGLELVGPLRQARSDIRILVLTGYGNIATAVAAVKEGAVDYLAKPADADAIEQALMAHGRNLPPPPSNPMSVDRVRWEHIRGVFEQYDRNVSETARRLNMHRRTLQRILAKNGQPEHLSRLDAETVAAGTDLSKRNQEAAPFWRRGHS